MYSLTMPVHFLESKSANLTAGRIH